MPETAQPPASGRKPALNQKSSIYILLLIVIIIASGLGFLRLRWGTIRAPVSSGPIKEIPPQQQEAMVTKPLATPQPGVFSYVELTSASGVERKTTVIGNAVGVNQRQITVENDGERVKATVAKEANYSFGHCNGSLEIEDANGNFKPEMILGRTVIVSELEYQPDTGLVGQRLIVFCPMDTE